MLFSYFSRLAEIRPRHLSQLGLDEIPTIHQDREYTNGEGDYRNQ